MDRRTLCLLLLALPGCPTSSTLDAGTDTPAALDAGTDTPIVDGDGGTDTPPDLDAPMSGDTPVADAPILPPVDAGDPFGDTGTAGPPVWVDVDVLVDGSTCPELVACGGDEIGTWDVTGGCFELPIGDRLSACPGATVTATGRARGRVTFTGTSARRVAQSEVVASIYVPAVCAGFLGGCAALEDLVQMQAPDSACVDDGRGNCDCVARQIGEIDDADGYTIEGNEIVSATLGHRWEYCVEGDGMRYRDTTPTGTREPGIIELGR